jgi:molybdate transport system substrate-binding protein
MQSRLPAAAVPANNRNLSDTLFKDDSMTATAFTGASGSAQSTGITVLSAAAVQVPVTELAEQFERTTGHQVHFEFSTAGGVDGKLKAGLRTDIVINARERLEALAAGNIIPPAAPRDLGMVRVGVAVRKGGVHPDVSNAEAFRASLLNAQSVAYGDPAKGATTGIHFAKVLERLGLADALKSKSLLAANGLEVMKLVAKGDAELGITQISEIFHIQGDTLVGPLPAELQLSTTYGVALGSTDIKPAARQFIELLLSTTGSKRFRHAGFQ